MSVWRTWLHFSQWRKYKRIKDNNMLSYGGTRQAFRHKHYHRKQSHNYGKRERARSDCNENNCKHDQRNDYVCHRIAFPYRVFYFDFLRNYSHSVLSPPLLSEPSVVSAEVLSSVYLSELSSPPLLSALFFL